VGEGADVLRGCAADVYIASEMSHADVMAANSQVRMHIYINTYMCVRACVCVSIYIEGEIN